MINCGVIFDTGFKCVKQISSVIKNTFFHLQLLSRVWAYLPPEDFERIIYVLITSNQLLLTVPRSKFML